MSKPKREYRMTEFTVTGRSRFPLDMLRYDSCKPYQSSDVGEIEDSFNHRRDSEGFAKLFTVRLVRFSSDGLKATAGRWASFGWTVVSDNGCD